MSKEIYAVGIDYITYNSHGRGVRCVPFRHRTSLADADIILISPTISPFQYSVDQEYQGRQVISQNSSGTLMDDVTFWKKELKSAIEQKKTIFVLLDEPKDFYYYSGNKSHSGTGKNRHTTYDVKPFCSYSILPDLSTYHPGKGNLIKYDSPNPILRTLWEENKKYFEYEVSFKKGEFKGEPIFFQKKGDNVLGGILKTTYGSSIVLLPAINFNHSDFTDTDAETYEESYTNEAKRFYHRFTKALAEIDKNLRAEGGLSPQPDWLNNESFSIKSVVQKEAEINSLKNKIQDLDGKVAALQQEIAELEAPKHLLYESGFALEKSIKNALLVIGIVAESYKDSDSEFDVLFKCEEGSFLGEAEGKDTKAIDVKKISQLMRNLGEYIQKEEVTDSAKGILFGNGYRLTRIEEREEQFTKKCIQIAEQQNISLVRTSDLYPILQYLSENNDEAFKIKCRNALLNNKSGIVSFPMVPNIAKMKKSAKNLKS
jgi:hypothetical protein